MVLDPPIGTTRRSVRFRASSSTAAATSTSLYRDTARKPGIQEAELRPTPTVFHGIVPKPLASRSAGSRWRGHHHSRRLSPPPGCATQSSRWPDAGHREKQLIHDAVALAKAAQTGHAGCRQARTTHFQPADNTKKIRSDPAQPGKYVTIDAYSGYHQIPLNPDDQIKTSFITPYGAYRYTTMPFGLAGATYQRGMQKCLQIIGRNVHAYVDDVVVKTKEMPTLLDDLRETFTNLRRLMKLNPPSALSACHRPTPGLPRLSPRNRSQPEKTAIEKMELPQRLKDVRVWLPSLP
ncbi:hypothetical protein QYE76_046728 [Lolium multiflorum]|uniref:Reverse transcriptase domain-containing protein n=1 Tax=Lolium multiflorum TaxID=4521 RepID=A0AAD8TMK3_LOLMU|nr:hypothetical protein QYE76_046728 [Lolium multiflorum]